MPARNVKPQAELSAGDGSLPSASREVASPRPSNARYRIADPGTAEQDEWLISKVQSKGKDHAVDWKEIEAQYEAKFGKPRPRRALIAKARKSDRITGPLYCATTWTQAQKDWLISEVDSWTPDSPDEWDGLTERYNAQFGTDGTTKALKKKLWDLKERV